MSQSLGSTKKAVSPFIGGVAVDSQSNEDLDVINPSTGKLCLSIPVGCKSDVDRAVLSSRKSFEAGSWSQSAPSLRKKVLHRYADMIAKLAKELDVLDAGEMGKPIAETLFGATAAAGLMRFYAEAVDKLMGDVFPSDKNSFVTQRLVPRGVIAAVVPWNFPTFNAVLKVGPALAAGNCVVLKPSELASRSAIKLARLAVEAGIPIGVFNVVPGRGDTVGEALGLHMDVDMITFTGSTTVGKRMLEYAGRSNMKLVVAECGGKAPQIVFDDGVDLNAASESIARFLLTNQGQICSVGSRLLVQRSVEAEVIEKIASHMKKIVIGDAQDPNTTFGPLVSAKQCSRVMQYIDSAGAEGAELVTGGQRVLVESGGYFAEPTIFRNVSPTARIAQEEIFGPVLSVISFGDESEAISIANSTIYGLAAYVWTANLTTGMRLAKGIHSSVVINSAAPMGEGPGHAFSGEPFGQSGIGSEGGLAGMAGYLRRHLIWINHA